MQYKYIKLVLKGVLNWFLYAMREHNQWLKFIGDKKNNDSDRKQQRGFTIKNDQ